MIQAPPGIWAAFETKAVNGGKSAWYHRRVVAFDDEGVPMVVSEHGLTRARSFSNFGGIQDAVDEFDDYRAVMPAVGWHAGGKSGDGSHWSQPLVAWGLKSDGVLVPLIDMDGYIGKPDDDVEIVYEN